MKQAKHSGRNSNQVSEVTQIVDILHVLTDHVPIDHFQLIRLDFLAVLKSWFSKLKKIGFLSEEYENTQPTYDSIKNV